MEFRDDVSRLDAFLASRRRATVLHALWKPVLAGAVASLAVSAAIWAVLPKFEVREVVVDRVVPHDVVVDHVVPHDVQVDHVVPREVEIEIPRVTAPTPPAPVTSMAPDAPRTPVERRVEENDPHWREAVVRGRILRVAPPNGFVLATAKGEVPFYPARLGQDGQPQYDPSMKDDVSGLLGLLGLCRKTSAGLYACFAVKRDGTEVVIPEKPAPQGELL